MFTLLVTYEDCKSTWSRLRYTRTATEAVDYMCKKYRINKGRHGKTILKHWYRFVEETGGIKDMWGVEEE